MNESELRATLERVEAMVLGLRDQVDRLSERQLALTHQVLGLVKRASLVPPPLVSLEPPCEEV